MDSNIDLGQIFLDDNYSIESLLAKTQESQLSLVDLRKRLLQHQQDLNQTSLELFNNSYDRFYKLSYIISCLAGPIEHLTKPLQTFRDQLNNLCLNYDSYVDEINKKLGSLEDTSKNKELARQLIALIKRRDRLERQIENIDWSLRPTKRVDGRPSTVDDEQANQNIAFRIKCDLLERINIELYHLSSEVRAIQPTHDELILIKKSLRSSLDDRQCQLDKWFESTFLEAIESHDKILIDLTLNTYRQIDAIPKLSSVWSNKVVKPYLNLTLNETQLLLHDQVSKTYQLLEEFIRRQLDLLKAEFTVRSFWRQVIESLEKLDKFYLLSDLETFQRRYIETRTFLRKQDEFILSESVNIGLSKEEVDTNSRRILSKFNLRGYFHHRVSQIASSLETSLTKHPLSEISQTPSNDLKKSDELNLKQFRLRISMHVFALVTKCWAPEIYIDALELKFSQLTCRILNRFADWLSKLRLSDFRITGPTSSDNNRQTNFLAKQDAIMRILLEDCSNLTNSIEKFLSEVGHDDANLVVIRRELILDSFRAINDGLNNVRSLQRLIER